MEKLKPIIFWEGLPVCGLLMKKVADLYGEDLVILGTRGNTPGFEAEGLLGHKVIWLDNPSDIWERREEFSDRNFIVHTGWVHHGWWKYDAYMRKNKKAKVVVMVDNRFRGDFRQWIGTLLFRLRMRKFFSAAFVPGKSGQKLMKFLGMPEDRIYTGLYGAYEGIFKETTPIENRINEFLFVGQLIERKSIPTLIDAFKRYKENGGTWNLRIIGNGPLEYLCKGDGITREAFQDPLIVAEKMNGAKVFVLPSTDDNWGTVICEAAACGMNLITTKNVGASYDLVRQKENGIVLESISTPNLSDAFFHFEKLDEEEVRAGSAISKEIAGKFDSNAYFDAFNKMVKDLC